MRKTVLW